MSTLQEWKTRVSPANRIAVRRVDVVDRLVYLISLADILYFFVGSSARRGLLFIPKYHPEIFRADRIYARTAKSVFLLPFRSLAELYEILDKSTFALIHQSVLANVQKVSFFDPKGKVKLLGISLPDGTREMIPVSRRFMREFESRVIGLPGRPRASKGKNKQSFDRIQP